MAILGDAANYGRYSLGILQEYADIGSFVTERKSFLQRQLKSEIFHLPFFKEILEETARQNLQRELHYWQQLS